LVPGTGIEPVRPLLTKAADFKSAVSTYFTTRASLDNIITCQFEQTCELVALKIRF
jgi:hypothetical protein